MQTADQILATRPHEAAAFFGDSPEAAYRRLAKEWHPDVSAHPKASEVFQHIVALRRSQTGGSGKVTIISAKGREEIFLTPQAETDTGRRWVGPKVFAWSFEKEPDLAEVFLRHLRSTPFADDGMREQMRTVFPKNMRIVMHDDEPMLLFPRRGAALLADWLGTHGPFPPVHAAWLGSGMLNIAAWASWSGWSLPALGPETVALNPATHEVMLFAGWEAAAAAGERPVVASRRTLDLCPALASPGYMPPKTLTLDMVRRTLREALGDPSGMMLRANGCPPSMAKWINGPSAQDGREDYGNWMRALERAFGPRRFVRWSLTVAGVYPYC